MYNKYGQQKMLAGVFLIQKNGGRNKNRQRKIKINKT